MSRLRVIIREEIEKFVSEKSQAPAPASSKAPAPIDDDSRKNGSSTKQ